MMETHHTIFIRWEGGWARMPFQLQDPSAMALDTGKGGSESIFSHCFTALRLLPTKTNKDHTQSAKKLFRNNNVLSL